MVEFALVVPVFLLLVFATIDYGGYFGSRLAVETAAAGGARVAAVQELSSFSGSSIVSKITSLEGPAKIITNADCSWNGTTLNPSSYPPFSFSGQGCIGIWYFDLNADPTGPPALCAEWSVQHSWWDVWNVTNGDETTDVSSSNFTTDDGGVDSCVAATDDIVVVGVGYQYQSLTPLPAIAANALITYGETEMLEEGTTG
jgi:hypothetical protein